MKNSIRYNRVSIFGIQTHPATQDEIVTDLLDIARQKQSPRYISTCTVYTLMQALDHSSVADALSSAHRVVADGMPLVWLQKKQGFPQAQRIYGPDLLHLLCDRGRQYKLKHYFWGSTEDVLNKLIANLQEIYPGVQIVGSYSPPYQAMRQEADLETVARCQKIDADIIWVGLGSPKQDLWMYHHHQHMKVPLLIGVGAAFDFIAGTKPQAPQWIQQSGLEWLFRLITEPRRLMKRYLIYNTRFIIRLICSRCTRSTPV